MKKTFVDYIRENIISGRWINNKSGFFEYNNTLNNYRFIRTTDDLKEYMFREKERNEENTPIVIKGFLAYLINHWGSKELIIYNTYNEKQKQHFLDIELKKAGSFKKDLDIEFIKQLLTREQKYITEFNQFFDYIPNDEKKRLLEFCDNYIEYTKTKNKQKTPKERESFSDLLIHENKSKLLEKLHQLLEYKKGKDVVIVIKALEELKLINSYSSIRNLHTLLTQEFKDIGGLRNFSNYMNETNNCYIQDYEINKIIDILQSI